MTGLFDSVSIILDGQPRELQATPNAGLRLSRAYDGFSPLLLRLRNLDLDAMAMVVMVGLNVKDSEAKTIPEKVFSAGVGTLLPPLVEYITILANGGQRPKGEPAEEESGNE